MARVTASERTRNELKKMGLRENVWVDFGVNGAGSRASIGFPSIG